VADNGKITIKTLTPQEIETLQVDAALRLIGNYSTQLTKINQAISQATIKVGRARIELDCLKNDKSTLIELTRALKIICERA